MKAVGLVVEYNPFHNGHRYHLSQAKKLTGADVVVAVMSGNFTQRGEPAIIDKWQRTRAALQNGVDLVVELPLVNVVEPGDRFASGALQLLDDLQVSDVVFGAEHPDWDFGRMVRLEQNFQTASFKQFDQTYATQFNEQLQSQVGVSLVEPNDILAFSYTKAKIHHHLRPHLIPIQRRGNDYHDEHIEGRLSSASAIRYAIRKRDLAAIKPTVPETTWNSLQTVKQVPSWEQLYPLLRNVLIQTPRKELARTYQMSEGLENRLKRVAGQELTFENFILQAKTKRYTYAHLTRLFLYLTLHATNQQVAGYLKRPYHHILGFTPQGQRYLHQIKKQLKYPMVVRVDQSLNRGLLGMDYRAGKLYQNFTADEQDLMRSPLRLAVK